MAIQVIDRLTDFVSNVVPTQQMREDEVAARIAARQNPALLDNKLEHGKTSTPSGNNY